MARRQRGSVEKRGSGWTARYVDASGRHIRKSGFRTLASAKLWLRRELAYLDQHDEPQARQPSISFAEFVSQYLAQHDASPARIESLRYALAHATKAFGRVHLRRLTTQRLAAWRAQLPEGEVRHRSFASVKQVLAAAVQWGYIDKSPATGIRNPVPRPKEFVPFASWSEIDAIEAVIDPHYRGLATFVVGTGLRTSEWRQLRWEMIDFDAMEVVLPASVTKTKRPRRIPLRGRSLEAIRRQPRATGLVFATAAGKPIEAHNFRNRVWHPAQARVNQERAAQGLHPLPRRRPYDLRHTYATWSLRAGMNTFAVARRMGTSIQMIELTYGHLASDSAEHERALLDAFDRRTGG